MQISWDDGGGGYSIQAQIKIVQKDGWGETQKDRVGEKKRGKDRR